MEVLSVRAYDDMAAAARFYANVVGWRAQDASTPDLATPFLPLEVVPANPCRLSATGPKADSA